MSYPRTMDELLQALDSIMGKSCGHSHFDQDEPERATEVEKAIRYYVFLPRKKYGEATLTDQEAAEIYECLHEAFTGRKPTP